MNVLMSNAGNTPFSLAAATATVLLSSLLSQVHFSLVIWYSSQNPFAYMPYFDLDSRFVCSAVFFLFFQQKSWDLRIVGKVKWNMTEKKAKTQAFSA